MAHYTFATRKPKRLTITVSYMTFERIQQLAMEQGRSASNLACYLIDKGLELLKRENDQ
ncbi:MAG: hypothetical protein FJ211_09125 [Ignavibacteria bacterium]|nr:hypothetical protein [Ignavibacteria bacterium]